MKAAASVIMNRVNSSEGEYSRISQGGSIRNIIYQKGDLFMVNPEDLANRRTRLQENNLKQTKEEKVESRQSNNTTPEVLTNPIYTPGFLRSQIGKLMRVEFLIGTNNMVDRIGFLEDVGASYILLRSFEGDSLIYADIYAIKFITISATYGGMNNFNNMNNNMMMNRY
jgi:hypothetical protein